MSETTEWTLDASFEAWCRSNRPPSSVIKHDVSSEEWAMQKLRPIMQEQNEETKASMMRTFLCEEYMTYSAQVALTGLKSKPELNGRIGMVAGELTAEGRLPVQLWDDGSAADVSVRIKLENLRPLPDDYLDPHEKEMKLRGGPKHQIYHVMGPEDSEGFLVHRGRLHSSRIGHGPDGRPAWLRVLLRLGSVPGCMSDHGAS